MLSTVDIRSPRVRIVLLAVLLILAPGVVLAFVGIRSIANRAEGLRTNYAVTVALVRDRVEAELDRLESDVTTMAQAFVAEPRAAADLTAWLQARVADSEWLEAPFFVHRHGGVITASLSSGWPFAADDPLELNGRFGGLVRQAETAEFTESDLDLASDLYREAATVASSPAQRCLALTRTGRTLFKADRFQEGIATYREVLEIGADVSGVTGAPCQAIALYQIGEGLALLDEQAEGESTRRDLLERLVAEPWDMEGQYGFYLNHALETLDEGSPLRSEATILSEAVMEVEWIRSQIAPRLRPAVERASSAPAFASRVIAAKGEESVQIGYRVFESDGNDDEIVAFGYTIRGDHLSGVLLPRLFESIELGADLVIGIIDEQRRGRGEWTTLAAMVDPSDSGVIPIDGTLAEAALDPVLPGWAVALLDGRGRSITQIVARENRAYALLMIALVLVLTAGVGFTVRAASHEVELSRLKAEFVASVTHDLKTPLSLIRMYGETLESGLVDDEGERREFFAIMRRESERLTHLINNVLDFGKIDSGAREYSFATEDIVAVVRESVDAYRYFFDRMEVEVDLDLPDEPIYVSLDRGAITQSLVNLLHNALEHGGDGKYIGVSVRASDTEVLVAVADRGVGIPEEQLPLVFEKYHRLASRDTGRATGSGLGLAIVKHAIEGHGGRIEVKSTPGRGSTFTVRLPVAAGGPVPSRARDAD